MSQVSSQIDNLQARARSDKGSLPEVHEKLLYLLLCFYFSDVCNRNQKKSVLGIFHNVLENCKPICVILKYVIEILK